MDIKDKTNDTVAKILAEFVLQRTGLVTIKEGPKDGVDLIAYQKLNPNKEIYIEAKATNKSETEIKSFYSDFIKRITDKSKQTPFIIFFIDHDKETGFFKVFNSKISSDLFKISVDSLTNQIKNLFDFLSIGMEFPPYSFDSIKHHTRIIHVEEKYTVLRLFNITLNPINIKDNLILKVIVEQNGEKEEYPHDIGKLFHNPNLPNFLFFLDGEKQYYDIDLPNGDKEITYLVTFKTIPLNQDNKFEMKLSCEYL